MHTSTQPSDAEQRSSSGRVRPIALLSLPAAGNTRSKRRSETSRYVRTPGFTANGQTPPMGWPTTCGRSLGATKRGFVPNSHLKAALHSLASPAHTTRTAPSPTAHAIVLAMRAGSQPRSRAASSTVALDWSNSMILSATPKGPRYARTLSTDMGHIPSRTAVHSQGSITRE